MMVYNTPKNVGDIW